MYGTLQQGITNSDYAWTTYNPTADRDSKGDPVSSEIITQKSSTFQNVMLSNRCWGH